MTRTTAALATSAIAFGGAFALLGPGTSSASSHREAPLIANDPQADNTDLYAFRSPDRKDSVTLIANWQPFEEPAGGPNFYPWATDARFNIKIDNNGDAKPDVTYQWTFQTQDKRDGATFLYNNGPVTSINDPNLLFNQTYTLREIRPGSTKVLVRNGKVAPSDAGRASMPDYGKLRDQAITPIENRTGASFVGQADDPFFLDLRVFDLLYGGNLSEVGNDGLAGYNVNTIALQVPVDDLASARSGDPVVGVWTTTDRRSIRAVGSDGTQKSHGKWVQVSRLGNPLVNEVVIPAGLKDAFNALQPVNDADVPQAVDRVLYPEVPKLIESIYGIPAPKTPRDDLFSIFLTGLPKLNMPSTKHLRPSEMLRLNTSIDPVAKPNRLGLLAGDTQGFPNGRRLTDDVVDIEVQALEGAARTGKIVAPLAAGDKVNANDVAFSNSFPNVALPHSGSAVRGGMSGTSGQPANYRTDGTAGSSSDRGVAPATAPVAAGLVGLGLVAFGFGIRRRGGRRSSGPAS